MHATSEAIHETQPQVSPDGRLVLTADARIDNRDELVSELKPRRREEHPVTDADLIACAYRRWGKQSPEHLRGAFAFAIWDQREQRLFCARDRMGLRPFHYFWSEPRFVFGSEINAVLAHPAVSRHINDTRVADFLARIHLSNEYTFYEDVSRLPPGHCAVIGRKGMDMRDYWTLTLPEERDLGSEEAYAEAFREVFSSAVEDRLRANGPVGSFLSGGLDSSSVTTMARKISSDSLHTFSATYDQTPSVDEREYIRAVLEEEDYHSHFVAGNDYDPLKEFPLFFRAQRKATLAHTPSQMWMLNRAVREAGLNVVLDGHGGDEVASHGHGYPGQLARERQWSALIKDLRGSLQDAQVSWPGAFLTHWLRYGGLPDRIGTKLLRLAQSIGLVEGSKKAPPQLISSDLARRTQINDRRRQHREAGPAAAPTERQYHFRQIASTIQPAALEELNHLASAHSVEPRFPFWDLRVVEFCLSLPSRTKRSQGTGKQIIRSGLAPILPDQVRTRTDKTEFRPSVIHALTHSALDMRPVLKRIEDVLAPYVDMEVTRSTVDRFMQDPTAACPRDAISVLQILRLGYFLEQAKKSKR
jgi:asparagine synthase (glutamine-hydrolysing)